MYIIAVLLRIYDTSTVTLEYLNIIVYYYCYICDFCMCDAPHAGKPYAVPHVECDDYSYSFYAFPTVRLSHNCIYVIRS